MLDKSFGHCDKSFGQFGQNGELMPVGTGMASLRDVAEIAGVSITTVSHVLNDVPGKRIAPNTRQRVRSAAAQLDYRPNKLAQGLRSQHSHSLGFVSDLVATTPYAVRMVLGAQEAAADAGYLMFLVTSGGDPNLEAQQLHALLDRQVDGLLYASMFHRVVEAPHLLEAAPTVLLDARSADGRYSSVVPDETRGARAAVEELARHGHRRIGFLHYERDIPARSLRTRGYQEALAAHDIDFAPKLVRYGEDAPGGYAAARELLDRTERPTALFCFTDRLAMGAYQAAQELGLRVPHDLSVVGFDDQESVAASLRPGLTTVALPHYEMGRWAVIELMRRIDTGDEVPPTHALLDCPLVRRESVVAPRETR
jgi:LacI family transcriptional regulator, galactose operon repressor